MDTVKLDLKPLYLISKLTNFFLRLFVRFLFLFARSYSMLAFYILTIHVKMIEESFISKDESIIFERCKATILNSSPSEILPFKMGWMGYCSRSYQSSRGRIDLHKRKLHAYDDNYVLGDKNDDGKVISWPFLARGVK